MDKSIIFKKADIKDIDILVNTRIEVLRAVNGLSDDVDMSFVKEESYRYYKNSLKENSHVGYLVYYRGSFVGCGGVSFYKVMPTYENPTGEKAYIMNVYVRRDYRRKGIATKIVDLLVKEAKKREIVYISLEATKMGKQVYEKYGFTYMQDEMKL